MANWKGYLINRGLRKIAFGVEDAFIMDGATKSMMESRQSPESRAKDDKLDIELAKGLKEIVPGNIDLVAGNIAGGIGGAINKANGRTFAEGFDKWNGAVRQGTDWIRQKEMDLGGNWLRKYLHNDLAKNENEVFGKGGYKKKYNEDGTYTPDWIEYQHGMADSAALGSALGTAADVGITWPLYGKAAIGALKGVSGTAKWLKGLSRMTRAAEKANLATKPIIASSKTSKPAKGAHTALGKTVSTIMNGTEAVAANPIPTMAYIGKANKDRVLAQNTDNYTADAMVRELISRGPDAIKDSGLSPEVYTNLLFDYYRKGYIPYEQIVKVVPVLNMATNVAANK